MKTLLIGTCLIGLMMVTGPATANTYERKNHEAGYYQKVDQKGALHHQKLLSAQHRDRRAFHGDRDRRHGWHHKKHNQRKHDWKRNKHGWKHEKHHQRRHGYHDNRYQFRYDSGGHGLEHRIRRGAQLFIEITR